MGHDTFLLPESYFREIIGQIGDLGIDTTDVLARCGIDQTLVSDGALRLSFSGLRSLLIEAKRLSQEPALGLLVGRRLSIGAHGILSFAMISSGSIRQAMEIAEAFIPLRTSLVTIRTSEQDGQLRVMCRETRALTDIRETLLEAVIFALKGLCDQLSIGQSIRFGVCFDFAPPAYAGLASDLMRCDVGYGQAWSGLWFDLEHADRVLRPQDAAAFAEATRICQRELERMQLGETESARLRRLFLQPTTHFPTLALAARLLCSTPRTLHRRLAEEGTSYKQLLDEARYARALESLRAGNLSIKELAFSLGYSDPANFRRAFRRWHGVAPSDFRALPREQDRPLRAP